VISTVAGLEVIRIVLVVHFMEIKGYQDKPFQSIIKTYRHPIVIASQYGSSKILNHQTTVLSLKHDLNITFPADFRSVIHFHKQAGYADITQCSTVFPVQFMYSTGALRNKWHSN
jgi:hypothetical protein